MMNKKIFLCAVCFEMVPKAYFESFSFKKGPTGKADSSVVYKEMIDLVLIWIRSIHEDLDEILFASKVK